MKLHTQDKHTKNTHFLTEHYYNNFWSSASSSDANFCTTWSNRLLILHHAQRSFRHIVPLFSFPATHNLCGRMLSLSPTTTLPRWNRTVPIAASSQRLWYPASLCVACTASDGASNNAVGGSRLDWLASCRCNRSLAIDNLTSRVLALNTDAEGSVGQSMK